MRLMITTEGHPGDHTIDVHNELLKKFNKLYDTNEFGANGGKGYYMSYTNINYAHIISPIHDKYCINDSVIVYVDTLEHEDEDE